MNKRDYKIIFMGTPEFAVPSLDILLKNDFNISLVVTTPDKPQGRGLKIEQSAIKKYALLQNLQIAQPEKLKNEEFVKLINDISPDIIVVVAFRILPPEIYTKAKLGAFNLHASLLPQYRGAAPINWVIINGENKTGVTTFFLDETVDTGNIIFQEIVDILPDDTAGDLHDRLMIIGANLVLKTVNAIIEGKAPKLEQPINEPIKKAPKIFKDDCRINWNQSADNVHNFIRGLSPYPTAFTTYKNKIIKIYRSEKTNTISKDIGQIITTKNELFVSCNDYLIKILELQMEGKKRLKADEFLRGYSFCEGDSFNT